jgi:hypothetical protein
MDEVLFLQMYLNFVLLRVKLHLEPLAIAVNVTQRANTRCDHVLVLLGQLRRVYVDIRCKDRSSPDALDEDDDHPVTTIINSIEKRWSKADQDLFIACVFLNPFIKTSLFNPQSMTLAMILGMLRRLYTRVSRVDECPREFMGEIMNYAQSKGIYGDQMWPIKELQDEVKDKVHRLAI